MSLREDCTRCGHDKATHFADFPSTGDVTDPAESGREFHGMCLGLWCECPEYVARPRS